MKPYQWQLVVVFIALIFTSSSVLAMGWGIRNLVDAGLTQGDRASLNEATLLLFVITISLAFFTFVRFFLITYVGEHVIADIRKDVFNHLIHMSPEFFETTASGDILSRLTTDSTLLQTVIGGSLSIAMRNILMVIGGIFQLIMTSPKLTGFTLLIVPVVIACIIIVGKRARGLSKLTQEKISHMSSLTEEVIHGIRTVQAFNREAYEEKLFGVQVADTLSTAIRRVAVRGSLTAMVITLVFGSIVAALWVGGHDVLNGTLSSGSLVSFLFYSVVVASAIGALSEVASDVSKAGGAAERIFDLLKIKSKVNDPEQPMALPTSITGSIQFSDVCFSYPSRPDTLALNHITLAIRPGEKIAFVGESGAGKSTIFQLLMRFYDMKSGVIAIDTIPINQLTLHDLRSLISIVPQDPIIFTGTVADNIRYGNPNATLEELKEAALAASALDFIQALPQGFDTHLGEKGIRLSGGQKQRLAISRSILKNPKILLLDEATSALDAENEKKVQQALTRLMENRTTLIIAHRFSTVQKADRIVVMDQGKIDSIGTHHELLKEEGIYHRLANLQLQG
ncbi:MAG: ATP-binding cassette domain-containing protein [Alphaproteobacteria bacterium]|nr:ATP-binding cassette domain-containing protein [Alphaproteobacteria bacterium]